MTNKVVYINGEYLPSEKASVSIHDLGFLRGYGVFDVMPLVHAIPFLHEDHWKRLEKSAWELGLHIPVSREDHSQIIQELLRQSEGGAHGSIRTILTGGVSMNGFLPENKETFCVLLEKAHQFPVSVYEKGVHIETLEYKRDFPLAKTTNYITPIQYKRRNEHKKDIFEILYVWEDKVLEASTSNICIIKDGALFTPYDDVLGGITRLMTLRLAREENMEVYGQDVSKEELFSADEVFLTASNKGIVPVVAVDGKTIGGGTPGPLTQKLLGKYQDFMKNYTGEEE